MNILGELLVLAMLVGMCVAIFVVIDHGADHRRSESQWSRDNKREVGLVVAAIFFFFGIAKLFF